jgi:transcriptional regulator with XRE-family HTH domain
MAILLKREVWRRAVPLARRREPDLTDAEIAALKMALRYLRVTVGGRNKLARALRVHATTLSRVLSDRKRPSAVIALRAAKLAGQPVDRVLNGAWPPEGSCPHCGRG